MIATRSVGVPWKYLNFPIAFMHSEIWLMFSELLVIWKKFLYGPTSLIRPSKSGNIPYGSIFDVLSNENSGALQLNEVLDMKPFELMQEIWCLEAIADPLLPGDAWFSLKNMPIKQFISSSESSFGFSIPFFITSEHSWFRLLLVRVEVSAISSVFKDQNCETVCRFLVLSVRLYLTFNYFAPEITFREKSMIGKLQISARVKKTKYSYLIPLGTRWK